VNKLVELAKTIRDHCDLIVHIVGENPGAIPDSRYPPELFRVCDEAVLRKKFPFLFDVVGGQLRWQQLSYTQWEAWLACFFGKTIAVCEFGEEATVNTCVEIVPMTMAEHLHLGRPFFGRPTECPSRESILIHVLRLKGDLLQFPVNQPSKVNFNIQRSAGRSCIADREVETQHFQDIISDSVPERVLLLWGPSNRGKSTLLKEFHSMFSTHHGFHSAIGNLKDGTSLCSLILKLAQDLLAASADFDKLCSLTTERGAEKLWRLFQTALSNTLKPIVLFIDTFEDTTVECKDWIEKSLLPFVRRTNSVRLVVAGHSVPNPIEPWHNICQRVYVGPIDKAKYWCQYRDALGLHSPNDAEIMNFVAITKGDPSILSALITSSKSEGAK
jgi:hypothetical protein